MTELLAFLGDYTTRNVVMGAILLGVGSGALGAFAVLRQQSLLGDALSHATLPGVVLGYLVVGARNLGAILAGALVAGTMAALLVLLLTKRSRLKSDAALGIVLSISFALGVVLLTFVQRTGGAGQGGLDTFLFGQAAAVLHSDLWLMGTLTAISLTLLALLWKEFKLLAFDPLFARSLGLPVLLLEMLLTILIAIAIVVGLQMVGVVLMSAMIVAPAAAARQWSDRLGPMVLLSALIGAGAGVAGALISAAGRNLATGPLIVIAVSTIVAVSLLLAPRRGLLWEAVRQRRASAGVRGRRMLATLDRLAREHSDPDYAAEQGMLDTYFGTGTEPRLRALRRRGLVRKVEHMPEEGVHWELTPAGRAEAERHRAAEGKGDA